MEIEKRQAKDRERERGREREREGGGERSTHSKRELVIY